VNLERAFRLLPALIVLAAPLALAAPARAQERTAEPPARWVPLSGFGMTIAAGGGVTDFTSAGAREVTDVGGSWDVRFAFRTRRVVGFEVSYIGGANVVHSLGLDTSQTKLIRNGIEGMVRINAPLRRGGGTLLEPYAAAGLGWNGYRITNVDSETASVSPSGQSMLALPLAAGFAAGYKGFVADVRATFRPTAGQTTLRGEGTGALTNWDVGGMVGFEF